MNTFRQLLYPKAALPALLLGITMGLTILSVGVPAKAADKVRIFSGSDEHWVPLQVAKAKNYFGAQGIDAEITVFTTGAAATEAFRAGRGDFISAGDLPSAAMWQSGSVIGLAPMSYDTEIFGIVGNKSIDSPQHMKGKKVATRVGSTGEFLLYRYLSTGGLNRSDVNIVDLAPPEMVIALTQGSIDAFAWLAPFTTRAISSGQNIKLIANAKGLANNRIILSVTKSFRDQNPELVKKVLRGLKQATDFIKTDPEEATKIWAAAVLGDVKQSLPVVKLISYDMSVEPAFYSDMNELSKFMVEKGALKAPISWQTQMDIEPLRSVDPNLIKAPLPN
jgi:ABC-type nitrate/sulfonate/bicarbonate transport system substrate-binding protein